MKISKSAIAAALLFLSSCGGGGGSSAADGPVSVRGWIGDLKPSGESYAVLNKPVSEAVRRMQMLANANVYVENVPYASGGISENGSFMILDVPPGKVKVIFQVPGIGDSALELGEIPPNADVMIPGVVIEQGKATVSNPAGVVIRVPGEQKRSTGKFAMVGGQRAPVVETPLNDLMDRRDYPEPPRDQRPIAIVR
jgi:hypothetical protein